MKTAWTIALASLTVLVGNGEVGGQDELSPNYAKHQILEKLCIGTWSVRGVSDGEVMIGGYEGRWAPAKECATFSCWVHPQGQDERVTVTGVIGWDPLLGKIREVAFSSDGGAAIAVFEVQGDKLVGKREGMDREGRKYSQKLEFVIGDDSWHGAPTASVGEQGNVLVKHGKWVFTRVDVDEMRKLSQQWLEFLRGQWSYAWTSEAGDFTEQGEATIRASAKGQANVARAKTEAGARETEIAGWQQAKGCLLFAGYSSSGSHWCVEFTMITDEKLQGPGTGTLPDGRRWNQLLTLTRKGENYEIRAEGTVEGEPFVTVGKMTRKQ